MDKRVLDAPDLRMRVVPRPVSGVIDWRPFAGYQPELTAEKSSPIVHCIGVELMQVSVRVEDVDAMGYLMVSEPMDRQPECLRTSVGGYQLRFVVHFPTEMIEARLGTSAG